MKNPNVLNTLSVLLCFSAAWADPRYRVPKSYEDTVRILVLTNASAVGDPGCGARTRPVGPLTRDFTLGSLTGIPNVISWDSRSATWDEILKGWPGKLPHVIVHVNAGWYSENGPYVNDILNRAADLRIGVVSIGDDAANFADKVFGFSNVVNQPLPMDNATQYRGSGARLWIGLDGAGDILPDNGVIRNTAVKMGVNALEFKPYGTDGSGDYRCEADADKYTIIPEYLDKLLPLGFQRAYDGVDTIGTPREYQTIVAFQDEARRGVALSFEPQFLTNRLAAEQIVYDAILFSSYAHLYNVKASLQFTDEIGAPLTDDAYWNPSKGKVYLTYTDDFLPPGIPKELRIKVVNRKGLAAPDTETISLGDPQAVKGEGVWRVEVPLTENPLPRGLNGSLETFFLGEVTATILTHGPGGASDTGMVTDKVRIAYPNQPELLKVQDNQSPLLTVTGSTRSLGISLTEQSFSKFQDTVYVEVQCQQSGDFLSHVALVETSPGSYASANLPKMEGAANIADGILSCLVSDHLIVTYVDEVYGTAQKVDIFWDILPVNPVRSAYIKDMDGNGAGDRVFIAFERELEKLPDTLGPVFWNGEGDTYRNPGRPSLAFDPSGDKRRMVADFSQSEFRQGLTSVPPGAAPYAQLPAGGIFGSQRAALADSMGPVILRGISAPFDPVSQQAQQGGYLDTLFITVSEPLDTRADGLDFLRYSKPVNGLCADYDHAKPVTPLGMPTVLPDGLRYVILLSAETGNPVPYAGDCIFLSAEGTVEDKPGNRAPRHGVILEGRPPSDGIRLFISYPPVRKALADISGFAGGYGFLDRSGVGALATGGEGGSLRWVPPADYLGPSATDNGRLSPLPKDISTMLVVSAGKYVARVSIFDNLGQPVRQFTQLFGYSGELVNPDRRVVGGRASFLVWDLLDSKGQRAGNGVYIWHVAFTLGNGSTQVKRIKMGILRSEGS